MSRTGHFHEESNERARDNHEWVLPTEEIDPEFDTTIQKEVDSKGDSKDTAVDLYHSSRGEYLMGQALWHAIRVMRTEKYPEFSNIADMVILMKHLFPCEMEIKNATAVYMASRASSAARTG